MLCGIFWLFFFYGPFNGVFMAMLWHYRSLPKWLLCGVIWGSFRVTKMFTVNPYGLTLGQLHNCLDNFHNCFISNALWAFSKCPFDGITETFDKLLWWGLRSIYFQNRLWLWFLVCWICSSAFFPAFRGVTEWFLGWGFGWFFKFFLALSLRWGLWVNLKWLLDIKIPELGRVFRNIVGNVSQVWSEKCFKKHPMIPYAHPQNGMCLCSVI